MLNGVGGGTVATTSASIMARAVVVEGSGDTGGTDDVDGSDR